MLILKVLRFTALTVLGALTGSVLVQEFLRSPDSSVQVASRPTTVDALPVRDALPASAAAIAAAGTSEPIPPLSGPAAQSAAPDCTAGLTVSPADTAMLALRLTAPCHRSARVEIRHAGLVVTGLTDAEGGLQLILPALEHPARVAVALGRDQEVSASADVDDLSRYDRLVLQRTGDTRLALHAFAEPPGGAATGHVHRNKPADPAMPGVVLHSFGSSAVPAPLLAEVLTMPADTASDIRITFEAAISAATCGRDLQAKVLSARAGDPVSLESVSIATPDCQAGDAAQAETADTGFLMLNYRLPGPTLAVN